MTRKKHTKIIEAATLPNVIEGRNQTEPLDWRGLFGNDHRVTLELG